MSRVGLCVMLAALGACVGPNFHRPEAPQVDRYTTEPLPAQSATTSDAGGGAQRFLTDEEVPRDWWTLFKSEPLNDLVAQTLRANPNIAAAQAALRQALEIVQAQRGAYWPSVDVSADASRNHDALGVLSPTLASPASYFNLFTPQVSVGFVPDVFGANRRQVESLQAQAEADRQVLDATYLTLTANTVTAAIQEAGLHSQIAATTEGIALARDALVVMRRESELGAVSETDVLAQEAVLSQWESALPPLTRALRQNEDLLASLTGRLPAEYRPLSVQLDELTLPARSAAGSAVAPGRAAARCACRRGTDACGDGCRRREHRKSAAAIHDHRRFGEFGDPVERSLQGGHWILECRSQRVADVVCRRHTGSS